MQAPPKPRTLRTSRNRNHDRWKAKEAKTFQDLLEAAPLYAWQEVALEWKGSFRSVAAPKVIEAWCDRCSVNRSWQIEQEIKIDPPRVNKAHPGAVQAKPSTPAFPESAQTLPYTCTHCAVGRKAFWIEVRWSGEPIEVRLVQSVNVLILPVMSVRKIGEYPPRNIEPPAALQKRMPKDALEFLKKGFTALEHSFGLGALAYFRRVVEECERQILDVLRREAVLDGDDGRVAKIDEAINGSHESDRLKIAASALPKHLTTGGQNPLARLYALKSEAVHALTEEQCIERAMQMRNILGYFFDEVWSQLERRTQLAKDMQDLG